MREKRQPPERGEIARDGSLKSIKGTYKARGRGGGWFLDLSSTAWKHNLRKKERKKTQFGLLVAKYATFGKNIKKRHRSNG